MARSFRFRLGGDDDIPESVVLKIPSADRGTRELGASAYVREVGFYRDIAARLGPSVPHCHHADIDDTGQDFVLVLADITPAVQGDQIAGCGVTEAARALTTLARIHAATWNASDIEDAPWAQAGLSASLADYMPMAMTAFEERFAALLDDSTWPVLQHFAARATQWQEIQPTSRSAVHGDYRLDNLLFDPTGQPATAVDWQTVSYGCPGKDVAYFLGNSVTTADRRTHERELVDHYLSELRRAGVNGYEAEECWDDIRYGTFQGPLVTMLGAFTASRSERSEPMFAAMARRSAAQIRDLDALDLLA